MALQIQLEPHDRLLGRAFVAHWRAPLAELPPLTEAGRLLASPIGSCKAVPEPDATVRAAIRDMLRSRDFKPTGRAKPASEFLARGGLRSINAAVDACNAVSLHSGIPISVVDCEQLTEPLRIRLGVAGESYVFNPAGQVIEVAGLLCLCDGQGPTANAIKDAQRTKTSDSTRVTLSILWSSTGLVAHTAAALELYYSLLEGAASVEPVPLGA